MLIFDHFPSTAQAEAFATQVKSDFDLQAQVFASQVESDAVDIFPFELEPPIVLVERAESEIEREVEELVESFGGTFAGT